MVPTSGKPGSVQARRAVAEDPRTPAAVLDQLAADPSPMVRRLIAGRPDTPGGTLAALAKDPDRKTREALALNPGCPPEGVVELLGDGTPHVRWIAVGNPNANLAVRRVACQDADKRVRAALALEQGLEPEINQALLEDTSWEVRQALARRTTDLATLAAVMTDSDPRVREGVAENALVTAEQSVVLAADPSYMVRATVVAMRRAPRDVITKMAHDKSAVVRWAVLAHYPERRDLTELLCHDSDAMNAQQARLTLHYEWGHQI